MRNTTKCAAAAGLAFRATLRAAALTAATAALVTLSVSTLAQTFTGNAGNYGASATFQQVGGNKLQITLTNTSQLVAANAGDVLTSLFFDVSGSPALSTSSLSLGLGSVYDPGMPAGDVLGTHWAFANGTGGLVTQRYGIGSSGLGLFSKNMAFSAGATQNDIDGANYGLISVLGYDHSNPNMENGKPYIKDSMVFVLAGYSGGTISNVRFQYGTSLGELSFGPGNNPPPPPPPGVPEPGSLALFAAGAVGTILPLAKLRRRR